MTYFPTARRQPRLLLSILFGVALFLVLPRSIAAQTTRAVVAWDAGVVAFLIAAWIMMLRASVERMQRRAAVQDERRWAILVVIVAAVAASVIAIGFELHDAKSLPPGEAGWRVGLAALTIVLSWTFTHTMFALHYAHEYYESPKQPRLIFPGDQPPDYLDFLYFSLVVGMTCQVSDVQIAERELRRTALVHGVLSFFFNTVILALGINIAASIF